MPLAFAGELAQRGTDCPKQQIAYMMSKRVVDGFEAVQIQKQHGELLVRLAMVPEVIHAVLVQKAGQGISVGQFLQLLPLRQELPQPGEQIQHPRQRQNIKGERKEQALIIRGIFREGLHP
ncbi:hypothetical protein D3C74_387020 [compost metagenome]